VSAADIRKRQGLRMWEAVSLSEAVVMQSVERTIAEEGDDFYGDDPAIS